MSARSEVLNYIGRVSTQVKNAASRDERFDLVESLGVLVGILEAVTLYERKLITELDEVD